MTNLTSGKHTQGPWRVQAKEDRKRCVLAGEVNEMPTSICTAYVTQKGTNGRRQVNHPEAIANANLIAAAPEMLEALELLTPLFADNIKYDTNADSSDQAVIKQAYEAMAKAKGIKS